MHRSVHIGSDQAEEQAMMATTCASPCIHVSWSHVRSAQSATCSPNPVPSQFPAKMPFHYYMWLACNCRHSEEKSEMQLLSSLGTQTAHRPRLHVLALGNLCTSSGYWCVLKDFLTNPWTITPRKVCQYVQTVPCRSHQPKQTSMVLLPLNMLRCGCLRAPGSV